MLNPHTLIISHRGNLSGPNPYYENSPRYIDEAIDAGFDVEIDVRVINGIIWLGHDRSDYKVSLSFLEARQDRLWAHCKNLEALHTLSETSINCFAHETDKFVLTKSGHIWVYPDKNTKISDWSIAVLPETVKDWDVSAAFGICTDEAVHYKKLCVGDI